MLLDLTVGAQTYVEDCEVCCNPILVRFEASTDGLSGFEAEQMD